MVLGTPDAIISGNRLTSNCNIIGGGNYISFFGGNLANMASQK